MTINDALTEISRTRQRKNIEPVGASPYEVVKFTGLPLAKVIAELKAMRADGLLRLKTDKAGIVYYCFADVAALQQPEIDEPETNEAGQTENGEKPIAQSASAEKTLQKLRRRQHEVLTNLSGCVNPAEYQRMAKEYSELAYKSEVEEKLRDAASANLHGQLDRAKRTVTVPHNYEKRGLSK